MKREKGLEVVWRRKVSGSCVQGFGLLSWRRRGYRVGGAGIKDAGGFGDAALVEEALELEVQEWIHGGAIGQYPRVQGHNVVNFR